jgi:hypothetical protein
VYASVYKRVARVRSSERSDCVDADKNSKVRRGCMAFPTSVARDVRPTYCTFNRHETPDDARSLHDLAI